MESIHKHAWCRRIVKLVKEATSLIATKLHDRIHFSLSVSFTMTLWLFNQATVYG